MPWLQIKITSPASQVTDLSELLMAAGALAVTLQDAADQPIFEPDPEHPPIWEKTQVIGLFETTADPENILHFLLQNIPTEILATHFEIIPDKDWIREWMKNFHPIKFGNRLWICPSWRKITNPTGIIVNLDPGLAFGTGTHPTTALCLEWLDKHLKISDRIIDYGCGSGILAIAALKLGTQQAWAIDNDPQAITATRENAARNQLSASSLTVSLPDQLPEWQADVLIANILAKPLIHLASKFATLVKAQGQIVLSGILKEQIDEVTVSYQTWFDMGSALINEDWALLTGTRKLEAGIPADLSK